LWARAGLRLSPLQLNATLADHGKAHTGLDRAARQPQILTLRCKAEPSLWAITQITTLVGYCAPGKIETIVGFCLKV